MLEEIAPLKQRWFELYSHYPDVRDDMLSTVVRWEWANGPRYATLDYYLWQARRGEQFFKQPLANTARDSGDFHYGYDAEGKIVISHLAGEAWERLYQFSDSFIETTNYDASNRILRGISYLNHEGGSPSHTIGFSLQGHPSRFRGTPEAIWKQGLERNLNISVHRADCTYVGESLIHISTKHWDHGWHHSEPDRLVEGEYQLDYLPGGELDRITWRSLTFGRSALVYRRLQPGETLKSLTEDVKSKLIEAIPKMVQQANFAEPLYCVQLHCLDGDFFPPSIIPGLESHRQRHIATYGNGRAWLAWVTVAEYRDDYDPALPIKDSAVLEACEKLQFETDYLHGAKTLYRIARALNQLNWSAYAPVTQDFIVFAYDEEDPAKALRLSGATPDQIADWRARGLLWEK